ncbi:MAG: methyl-accepting chemotaxis protein, partial [Bdellovibrionales bacterium]|nr:methyl-accepting chemotaxis protein [Bdellovibrionales bacterium]
MFTNMSLKGKLLSYAGLMSFILLAVGGNGLWSLTRVTHLYNGIAEVQMPNVVASTEMEILEKSIVLDLHALQDAKFGSDEFKKFQDDLKSSYAGLADAVKEYEGIPFGPGEEEQWKVTKPALDAVIAFTKSVNQLFLEDKPSSLKEAARRMSEELPPLQAKYQKECDKSQQIVVDYAKKQAAEAKSIASFSTFTAAVGSVVGVLFALLCGFFIATSLAKTLLEIAGRLTSGSREVASATDMIAEAGTELSASSTEQAAALQETVASLEEVSAMVNKSADNARRSLETSGKSQEAANKGKLAVEEMIGSIGEINRSNTEIMGQIEQSNREIAEIVKVIGEIGNKTKVINDIVFQTKLLSFNASVEAARAGEHGKGFAVVAEEVGNLAQMSGNAAKEISGMLEESMRKVQTIADETKSKVERLVVVGREKIESGSVTANRCASVLEEIVTNVGQVNQMVDEIATACREQAQGVQEINQAMTQLDQVTQQNTSAAQQSATAANQLRAQTGEMDAMVGRLSRTVQGAGGGSVVPAEKPTREP